MKGSINETLKIKLIDKPTPRFNKSEFKQLYDRICSNPNDIVTFLDAEDTGKKAEIAKRIIDTMVLESNFPPTSNILDNLAIFEQNVRHSRSIKNKSRDHYIHMCYLYFLGLFLFFYSQDFNEKLHGTLTLMKHTAEIGEEINFVKSFLSAWKYFVLYHDLAYPLEYLGNKENQYNVEEEKMREKAEEVFAPETIWESILNQIALKAMSTIMAVRFVIDKKSSKATYLFNYLKRTGDNYNNFDNKTTFSKVLEKFEGNGKSEITYLQYIKRGDDIKFFYTIFDRTDFIIVFKHNSSLECIAYRGELYVLKELKHQGYIRELMKNKQLIFSDDFYLKYPQLEIEYYGVNLKKKFEDFLEDSGINLARFEKKVSINKRSKRMKEVVQEYYFECYDIVNMELSPNNILKKLQSDIIKGIFDHIREQIKMDNYDSEFVDNQSYYAKIYTEEYIGKLKEIIPELDKRCSETIGLKSLNETMDKYDTYTEIQQIYKLILDKINRVDIDHSENDIWTIYDVENISNEISECDKKMNFYIRSSLQKATNSADKTTVFDILSSYHLKYSEYDHGIVAADFFLKYWSCYQRIISENKQCVWIRIGFNIPFIEDHNLQQEYINEKYVDDYLGIIGQITYAILIHNLYPKCFSGEINSITTNILENPFAYFCMVCDMLQNWGRPYNINPITESNPLFLDSKEYNILIDDYITVLFAENDPQIISERLKNFGEELDTYLLDASEMIRTSFDNRNK